MYGWRGKIGIIIPSSNTTMEMEFHRNAPIGVSVHTARVTLPEVNTYSEKKKAIQLMNDKIESSSRDLASAEVSLIVYGCTIGSLLEGIRHDEEIARNIENVANVPSLTVTSAIIDAIKYLGISKIAIITPYINEINVQEKKMLERNISGIDVLSIKGLGIVGNIPKGKLDPFLSYKIIKKLDVEESDGVFVSCTNWRTFEIIEYLEKDLNKPIISSNQAALWASLRSIGVNDNIKGLGKLFTI